MISFALTALAALLASTVNLMTKRNLDEVGNSHGYLVIYFLSSLLSCFFITPQLLSSSINFTMLSFGSATGILMLAMMILLPKALQAGPPGLTYAFQNASSVLPAVFLFLIFGPPFDFVITPWLIVGICCVLFGLFYSAFPNLFSPSKAKKASEGELQSLKTWSFLALATFLLQGIILSIFHFKNLIINPDVPDHPLIFAKLLPEAEIWFMPGLFIVGTLGMAAIFFFKERRMFLKPELIYGSIGGILNGIVTYLLLVSTAIAPPEAKGILFPLFAVGVITFCSAWGQKLYQERVNWIAIGICILGVILGAL